MAVITTCGMALFHFVLPFVYGWPPFLLSLPPAIRWGSYSINFFFSFLLLGGGLLTLIVWRTTDARTMPVGRAVLILMCAFWVANVVYQLVLPMPMPRQWVAARFGLIGFAALSAAAYGISVYGAGART
jgi:hypothetical protein